GDVEGRAGGRRWGSLPGGERLGQHGLGIELAAVRGDDKQRDRGVEPAHAPRYVVPGKPAADDDDGRRHDLYFFCTSAATVVPLSISVLRRVSAASILREISSTAAACSRGTKATPASSAHTRSPART